MHIFVLIRDLTATEKKKITRLLWCELNNKWLQNVMGTCTKTQLDNLPVMELLRAWRKPKLQQNGP